MGQFIAPGIYIQETDLSQYAPALATAIFAVLGITKKGPVNKPTMITNESDLLQRFGQPTPLSYLIYAGQQYLRNGRQLIVVRVTDGSEVCAQVSVPGTDQVAFLIGARDLAGGVNLSQRKFVRLVRDSVEIVVDLSIGWSGSMTAVTIEHIVSKINAAIADVEVEAEAVATVPGGGSAGPFAKTLTHFPVVPGSLEITAGLIVGTDDGEGNITGTGIAAGAINYATGEITGLTYDAPVAESTVIAADYSYETTPFVGFAAKDNLNSHIVLRSAVAGVAGEISILAYSDSTQDAARNLFGVTVPYTVNGLDADTALDVYAHDLDSGEQSPGEWANDYYVTVDQGTNTGTFRIRVYNADANLLETWDNLTKANVEATVNSGSRYIGVDDLGNDVPPAPATFAAETPTAQSYYLSGGEDGITGLSDADYIGTIDTETGQRSGLKTLEDVNKIDVNLIAVPGISSGVVILELLDLCRRRGDCMAIIDPPLGLSYSKAIDWHNGDGAYDGLHPAFNSSYGAVYWPWIEMYDSINEQRVYTPPSGWAAAQIAYTDYNADPWFAPAGLVRGKLETALKLEHNVDLGQMEMLYGNGNVINPIVDFTSDGIVIWGQRTLQRTASALDRINVRRMLLYAEKIIATISKILAFEPNDETLWRRAEALINPVLNRIKTGRGIEKFSVVIDESTNPSDVRNRNEMHGKLFIIPVKAAEKIVLNFVILPSGAEFSEE